MANQGGDMNVGPDHAPITDGLRPDKKLAALIFIMLSLFGVMLLCIAAGLL